MFPILDGASFATNLIGRWVGSDLKARRGLCHLEYPIRHGIIEDWNKMELLWKHIFSDRQLGIESKEHPVLVPRRSDVGVANGSALQSTKASRTNGRVLL